MSFSAEEDGRLAQGMRAAQGGDKAAYALVLREVQAALRRFLARRIKSSDAVEDVAQEILISIHSVRHTYRPDQPFGPWMYAIARNRLADYWRKQFRLRAEIPTELETMSVAEAERPDRSLSDQMAAALGALSESQRSIVTMLKIDGLSIRETADKMGMTEGAVKVAAHRAYGMLRKRFTQEAYQNDEPR